MSVSSLMDLQLDPLPLDPLSDQDLESCNLQSRMIEFIRKSWENIMKESNILCKKKMAESFGNILISQAQNIVDLISNEVFCQVMVGQRSYQEYF